MRLLIFNKMACGQQRIAASVAEVILCGLPNDTASDYLY